MVAKVYLDLCALKRPFDDQSQGRIWIETQAVIRILRAIDRRAARGCNSAILEDENRRNTNAARREKVTRLLLRFGIQAHARGDYVQERKRLLKGVTLETLRGRLLSKRTR